MEIAVGLLIGFIIATTGLGAGILTTPVLLLLFGLPPAVCVGTALVFSTVIKIFATLLYARHGRVNGRVLAHLLAGGVPGAVAGALLLRQLQSARLTPVVLSLIGLTVVFSALLTLLRPVAQQNRSDRFRAISWLALPIGVQVGFSSSGAGALGTVLLFRMSSLSPVTVVGTDLAFGLALSTVAGAIHLVAGNCLPLTLAKLLIGGLVGVPVGAFAARGVSAPHLRMAVLVWATCLGALLAEQGLMQLVAWE